MIYKTRIIIVLKGRCSKGFIRAFRTCFY